MKHDEKENDLRALQLSYIGKILSRFTHEINNHLAFIKESAGLIGDLIESKKSLDKPDLQQSLDILQSISDQIRETAVLSNCLNRFAHRMDKTLSTFDVNRSLEELLVLLTKFANQKRIRLEKDFHKDLPAIHSDPAKLQFLIFCLIEEKLRKLEKNSSITVKTVSSNGFITIEVISKGNIIETVEEGIYPKEIHHHVIKQLGGKMAQIDEDIAITLPLSISSAPDKTYFKI